VIDEIFRAYDIHPKEIRNSGLPTCSGNAEKMAPMLPEAGHSRRTEEIDEIRKLVQTQFVRIQTDLLKIFGLLKLFPNTISQWKRNISGHEPGLCCPDNSVFP
jgi:hypothetical protein